MEIGLQKFLDTPAKLPKVIVIYGPTASGKTSMSIDIAQKLETQIISTDSRQLYRYMDIGTAKVTPEEMNGVMHQMIDICEPTELYSVGRFVKEAEEHMQNLILKNKIPVLCGGTGLYIDAIRYQFDIPEVLPSQELRDELESFRINKGNQALWDRLNEIDPDYAQQLHPNNYRYVERGIEVFMETGRSKMELKTRKIPKYDVYMIAPNIEDRAWLYDRINRRVDIMLDAGLIQEVEWILSRYKVGISQDFETIFKLLPAMNTIGYKEVIQYLQKSISHQEMKDAIAQNSRKYAKRQLTWFRNNLS